MITQNTGWKMINKKTSSKDNILPKLFQNSPEKKLMDNFQKVSVFFPYYCILLWSVRAWCLMNDIIILTKISDRRM